MASVQPARRQAKAWCFTLNNPEMAAEALVVTLTPLVEYGIFQEENAGTTHFQGYLELKKPYYLSGLKKIIASAHWEERKGTREQARAYCTKDKGKGAGPDPTWVAGPWEIGQFGSTQGKRTDLASAIATMRDSGWLAMVRDHPEAYVKYHRGLASLQCEIGPSRPSPPEVNIFYGQPGCGKSHTARLGDGIAEADTWSDPIGSSSWFDGYNGQSKALFDDFDGAMSHVRLKDFLRVTDCYSLRVPVKGSFVLWNPRVIQVTSNYHPRRWWDWSERGLQYKALMRRVTRVYHWRTDCERQDPIIIDRDGTPDLWDLWWKGPPEPVIPRAPTLGPIDDWVEHIPAMATAEDIAAYDFVESQL